MKFEAPKKFCPTCGKEIPQNGYELNPDGTSVLDEHGSPIWRDHAELICETCARNSAPPSPPRFRRMRDYKHPDQIEIDVPAIAIS